MRMSLPLTIFRSYERAVYATVAGGGSGWRSSPWSDGQPGPLLTIGGGGWGNNEAMQAKMTPRKPNPSEQDCKEHGNSSYFLKSKSGLSGNLVLKAYLLIQTKQKTPFHEAIGKQVKFVHFFQRARYPPLPKMLPRGLKNTANPSSVN